MVIKSIIGFLKGGDSKEQTKTDFEKNVVEPIINNRVKVIDIVESPQNFEGKEVWIDACDVVPGMKIVGVFAHSINDSSATIDGFSSEQIDGHGDVGGLVKLTSKGTPYIEF